MSTAVSTAAIEIHQVTKSFKLYREKAQSAKERVIRAGRNPHTTFKALDDVSFSVGTGETVALLGHNGSGKSTLLKCVAGTLRPTSGRIVTRGRLAALLELGAGFHPDLTGRENVYLNGSILGFSHAAVDRIFDDIVEFAELEQFIDNQVKHYSSGMYARLGFAVAINVDPDVLLVDEVLSVGDEAFQRKCLDRVQRLQREGRTILLVSHATETVRQVADRVVVLDHGHMVVDGRTGEAIRAFRETLQKRGIPLPEGVDAHVDPEATGEVPVVPGPAFDHDPSATVAFKDVTVRYHEKTADHATPGEPLSIEIPYHATGTIRDVVLSIEVFDVDGHKLMGTNTDFIEQPIAGMKGDGTIVLHLETLPLLDGRFHLRLAFHTRDGGRVYDERDFVDSFQVMNPTRTQGTIHLPVRVEHLYSF
ncbi:MAG: ABC transporter ATP-binding protein [Actinobacteria bacterium]|nr:ABC transporter ATP-binding protein [Actinomycetota bacterium]